MNISHHHLNVFQKFFSLFHNTTMHVKISKEGMKVLRDKRLTRVIIDKIIEKKKELDEGLSIPVQYHGKGITLKQSGSSEVQPENKNSK